MQDFTCFRVHHLNGIAVRRADINNRVILGKGDAARAFTGRDGAHDLKRVDVDHADRIVLFVGDPNLVGKGRGRQKRGGGKGDKLHLSPRQKRCIWIRADQFPACPAR